MSRSTRNLPPSTALHPVAPKSPKQALCEHRRTRCPGARFVRSLSAGLQPCWVRHKQKGHAESQRRRSSRCKEPPEAFQPHPLHLHIPAPSWEVPLSPCMDRAVGEGAGGEQRLGSVAGAHGMVQQGKGDPQEAPTGLVCSETTTARRCRTSLVGSYQWPPSRASPDPDGARKPGQVPRHPSAPAQPGGSYL